MMTSEPMSRDARRRRYRDFDKTLYVGCCVCQLCGISSCPNGTGGLVTLHRRPYSVCPDCMDDKSIWFMPTGEPRRLPKLPPSRGGQYNDRSWYYEKGING